MRQLKTKIGWELIVFCLLTIQSFSAEITDVSFSNPNWQFTSGATYDPVTEEVTIVGDANAYEYARITINLPGGTSSIYLSGDVFLENIVLGSVAWYAPKVKIVGLNTENLASPAQGSWYNAFVDADASGESQVTLEFGFQNSSGIYTIKNPKITDSEPIPTPYSFPYSIPANTNCQLGLISGDVVDFNNDLLSTNCHFSWASKSWSDTEVINTINNSFPMSNYRFPGGTVGNFYDYTTDGYHNDASTFDNNSRLNAYNAGFKFDYPGFKNQVIASSGTATLMFNVIHDDVATASNRLQSRINDGLNIKWIEFGNENFFGTQSYGYASGGQWQVSDVDEYISHTKSLTTAFKAIDNSIGLTVNINHNDYTAGGWSHKLSNESYYDATTMHNYNNVGNENLDFSSGVVLLDSYKYTRKNIKTYKTYFGTTPMVVTEWGVLGSKSFLGVISAADMFLAFLEGNTSDEVVVQAGIHMMYHSDGNNPQSLMYMDGGVVKYTPTGSMYSRLYDVFKNQKVYKNLSVSSEVETDLPGTISRAVDLGDSIRIFSVNKLPVVSELDLTLDGVVLSGDYRIETYSMSPELWPAGYSTPIDPWVNSTGSGKLSLPAYSITIATVPKPNVTAIMDVELKEEIVVFPNPTSDVVFLKNVKMNEKIQVYDVYGKLLKTLNYNSKGVELSAYSKGNYLLKVGSKSVVVQKK